VLVIPRGVSFLLMCFVVYRVCSCGDAVGCLHHPENEYFRVLVKQDCVTCNDLRWITVQYQYRPRLEHPLCVGLATVIAVALMK
jgi:hypothetical protein